MDFSTTTLSYSVPKEVWGTTLLQPQIMCFVWGMTVQPWSWTPESVSGSFQCYQSTLGHRENESIAMCKLLDLKICTQKGPNQGYTGNFLTPEQ